MIIAEISILIGSFSTLGILIGSLTAEYGGVVNIRCEKTGYHAEIEFKLKVREYAINNHENKITTNSFLCVPSRQANNLSKSAK